MSTVADWGPKIPHGKARCPVPKGTLVRACVNKFVLEGRVFATDPASWKRVDWYQLPELQAMKTLRELVANPKLNA